MLKTFLITFGVLLVIAVILNIVFGVLKMLWHVALPVFVLALAFTAGYYFYRWLTKKKTVY